MIPDPHERPTMTGREVAPLLGVSYASLMRAAAEDRAPVAFVRCGSRVSFVTADVLRVLRLDEGSVLARLDRELGAVVVDAERGRP